MPAHTAALAGAALRRQRHIRRSRPRVRGRGARGCACGGARRRRRACAEHACTPGQGWDGCCCWYVGLVRLYLFTPRVGAAARAGKGKGRGGRAGRVRCVRACVHTASGEPREAGVASRRADVALCACANPHMSRGPLAVGCKSIHTRLPNRSLAGALARGHIHTRTYALIWTAVPTPSWGPAATARRRRLALPVLCSDCTPPGLARGRAPGA